MRWFLLAVSFFGLGWSAPIDPYIQHVGIEAEHGDEIFDIRRERPKECRKVSIEPGEIWGGHFANPQIPKSCRGDLVRTVGQITPMHLHPEIETYGELEVLHFIQEQGFDPENYLLIDSRGEEWFEQETIPSATNISFRYLRDPSFDQEKHAQALTLMGIKKKGDGFDFTRAKTLLLFCNGPWCGQSPVAMKALLKMGYPHKKLKWYRGGMHDWKSLSMTTTLGKPGIRID